MNATEKWQLLNNESDILIIQLNIMTFSFIIILTLSAGTKLSANHCVACACYGNYALTQTTTNTILKYY